MSENLIRLRARDRVRKRQLGKGDSPVDAVLEGKFPDESICDEEVTPASSVPRLESLKLKPHFTFPPDSVAVEKRAEAKDFICPVCGNTEYNEIREGDGVFGSGYSSRVVACECQGCTVHFGNPGKFSVAAKKK